MFADKQRSIHFVNLHVVERDYVYFASRLDELDSREYVHSRLVVYDAQSEKQWYFHDAEMNVVSVCAKRRSDVEGRKLCALSKEGEIEFFSNKDSTSRIEKIAGAGVRLGTRGYVSRIKEIGARLFVCGGNNQIYQRRALDWELISGGDLSLMQGIKGVRVISFTTLARLVLQPKPASRLPPNVACLVAALVA